MQSSRFALKNSNPGKSIIFFYKTLSHAVQISRNPRQIQCLPSNDIFPACSRSVREMP